ncbi:Molybdenum cofactor guanylyltransferase [Vibrio aerogenes CECT 7868]|uniref:Molybdenum cofactor guanylyltransferase n=1 Tax=Vibrio aerogenes CECT 7868 TaxID=1216006 RepID=A0A1M5Z6X9_9VIBR|nr:molybdenum cofactor guanylyltransferase MobA [Vibrio aerogenes]SHI20002.1 Molybdenum cofactor guanylyltransferase [Vibrio aerogenes CECT 7868]
MITNDQVTWVILAGGQASRMGGQDKGLIPYQGKPLVRHVLDAILPITRSAFICANRNIQTYTQFAPVIQDQITGYAGPLAGLHSALSHSKTEWTGILPCDGPFVDPAIITRFYQATVAPGKVFVAHDGENIQPVYALVHCSVLPQLTRYLREGERKVALFYKQTGAVNVDCSDIASMFTNMNTPEQLNYHKEG